MSPFLRIRSTTIALTALALGALPALTAAAPTSAPTAPPAAPAEGGMTLVVPEAKARLGRVYYVQKGRDAQVTFTSDAPLEYIKGTTNQVIGYAVLAPAADGKPARLVAGEFHLPIVSFDTGIPMRNQHLQSDRWLNAPESPDVIFTLSESRDAKLAKHTEEADTYELTLVGDMTIKKTTKEMTIPARITVIPESAKTRIRAPGDLLGIRCKYSVKLSEFGVSDQAVGVKVADEMEIDTALFLTSVEPKPRPDGPPPAKKPAGEK